MKKQGYNSRDDEAIAARNGKKKQSLKDRRNESKGMYKHFGGVVAMANYANNFGCKK